MIRRFFPVVVIACIVAAVVACGKSNPSSPTPSNTTTATTVTGTGSGGTGTLTVKLKDSPFSEASAYLVTFSDVSVHLSGGDWQKLTFAEGATSRTCDLKLLQNATDILGVQTMPAGHYTQIRLTVTDAKLYFPNAQAPAPTPNATVPACTAVAPTITGATPATVNIPSGELKLNREFDLAAGAKMEIVLDFDGDKSVKQLGNGKYQMSPVISVVSVQ